MGFDKVFCGKALSIAYRVISGEIRAREVGSSV